LTHFVLGKKYDVGHSGIDIPCAVIKFLKCEVPRELNYELMHPFSVYTISHSHEWNRHSTYQKL